MAVHCRIRAISLLAAGLLLASCKDTKISSYRVPKDSDSNAKTPAPAAPAPGADLNSPAGNASAQPPDATLPPGHPAIGGMPTAGDAGSAMASTQVPTDTEQSLVWTAPAGWAAKKGSAMRKGSYAISGAEGAGDVSSSVSTHHTSLKVYAANTPGVLNAAAGVDEVTLAPNYQLRLGVPGASAGIQTAERLGLNSSIVAAARQRLGSQQVDIARFLDRLHKELAQLEEDRKAARAEQYALNQEKKRLEREGDIELRNRTRDLEAKLASLLKDFEFQMRETVRAIEDRAAQQKLSKEAERRILRLRCEFQESFNQTVVAHRTGADVGDQNAQPHILKHIAAGDQVRLKSLNKIAIVQREVEKDIFEVALGPIKMRVRRDECCAPKTTDGDPAKESPLAAARQQKNVHVTVTSANTDEMRMEINLIGRTVDEATEELEKYLDRAFLAGLPRVRIIHGHGAGILRRGVREFLKSHPHVATLAEAPQNEGGQGATLVELRQ